MRPHSGGLYFDAINNKNNTVATFTDLKKAFDAVKYDILISKLYNLGVRNKHLDWIHNYICTRKQRTLANNHLSTMSNMTSGVPKDQY